jgi:Holliday junction resolvase
MKMDRKKSIKSEKELAKSLKGRRQPASGSLPVKSLKGDVRTVHWLIDDKITAAKSFSLKLEDLRKIRKQAWNMHKRAAISVNFADEVRVFVISELDFTDLCTMLTAAHNADI